MSKQACYLASALCVWEAGHLETVSILFKNYHSAHYKPLVCFLSLLKFLRKLSWLNGLAESFCGEAWLSAVNCRQREITMSIEDGGHTISRSNVCLNWVCSVLGHGCGPSGSDGCGDGLLSDY